MIKVGQLRHWVGSAEYLLLVLEKVGDELNEGWFVLESGQDEPEWYMTEDLEGSTVLLSEIDAQEERCSQSLR